MKNIEKNDFMNDTSLSFKAKGIFCYLQRQKLQDENALYRASDLRDISCEGKDAIKSAIDELVGHGYLAIHTVDPLGRYVPSPYTLYSQSQIPEIDIELPECLYF